MIGSSGVSVRIKFYKNLVMLIRLHFFCGYFGIRVSRVVTELPDWPAEPTLFTVCPFAERVCPPHPPPKNP